MNEPLKPRRHLPLGVQTFAKIRSGDFYYVDKTEIASRLIENGSHYFLSRPRRFGKSLFIDTLKELFEGNEPLFRGLYIHDKWDWSIKYPVLRFSFGGGVLGSREELNQSIHQQLAQLEQDCGRQANYPDARSRFKDLIIHLHRQTGQRVVVLVDEYDKPILDCIDRPDSARDMREGLKDMYSVIKDNDASIRFAFLTGVSKFSKVSLFSGLNNLDDITLDREYGSICGYTERDLDEVFAPELAGLDRAEIRRWYNGYNWLGEPVYNPFGLLMLFRKREFGAWWFETGTPSFLVKLLFERRMFAPDLERVMTTGQLLSTFDVDTIAVEALMFQAGYLTIESMQRFGAEHHVTLRYPNQEVRQSLSGVLLLQLIDAQAHPGIDQRFKLYQTLLAGDLGALRTVMQSVFAGIPHDWYRKNQLAGYEGYYASIFYCYFAALGLDMTVEDATSLGRIDLRLRLPGRILLFEFKVVEMEAEGAALAQLRAKCYADKYRAEGVPITLIGVEFSRESRNIVAFELAEA